jgi:undecaprenyl phosphate-alpha-L-ara4FN deformylase
MEVALKIDVDTHQGLGQGVPRLARMLADEGVAASFFVAMGPDNSGRAIMRVFKNPGFLSKMRRTRAVSMYGLRTVLSGTLLPARSIALAYPQVVRETASMGFEMGVHGYDHVLWQDHLDELGEHGIATEIAEAFETCRAITGVPARSFAAPGWRTGAAAQRALEALHLDYRSDTRGSIPYRCSINGEVFPTPEIPTTLPTMDEVMGEPNLSDGAEVVRFYLEQFREDRVNVHTIHAETEGMAQLELFSAIIRALKKRGAKFVQLRDVARRLAAADLPVCEVVRGSLPGRAGWVSMQGTERSAAVSSASL